MLMLSGPMDLLFGLDLMAKVICVVEKLKESSLFKFFTALPMILFVLSDLRGAALVNCLLNAVAIAFGVILV